MSLFCLMLMTLPAAVQVTVAPDQPLPYVYTDDPLIIEFLSDSETDIDTRLVLKTSGAEEHTEIQLEKIHLYADSEYWYAVHDAPRARGFYAVEIFMETDTETFTSQTSFCRIDRPDSLQHLPIYAYCSGTEDTCPFPAIRSIGIDTFRCDMNNDQFTELATNVSRFGANLIVAMTLEQARNISESEIAQIQSQCENIFRLDISLGTTETNNHDTADILREIGCPAVTSIVVPNVTTFEQQIKSTPSLSARHATLMTFDWPEPREVSALRSIAAQQGQEGWQVHILCPVWQPGNTDETIRFIHKFLQYRASNVSYMGVNANVLANDTGIQEIMAYLNGLALRFHHNVYIGALSCEGAVQAPVFRSGATWFLAFWSEKEGDTISVPVDGAVSLKLTDALGNDIPLPAIEEGSLTFPTGLAPLYLTGHGGVILGHAAINEVTVAANEILNSEFLTTQLPPAILDLVRKIVEEPQGSGSRLRFLELLRVLPRLEESWHTHQLAREVAVPALVALAKLARTLCLVEEDRGEHFLEPLADTIDRAAELQSLYLTGSAGTAQARKRGDWILGEVRRLIDEAEALEQADRKIEATAVATVAEWRAHCLTYAAQAEPIRETVPEIQPLLLPEPVEDTESKPLEGEIELLQSENDREGEQESATETIEDESEDEIEDEAADDPEVEVVKESAPAQPENVDATESKGIIHTVKSGDNPYDIARKYKVSVDDLLKWNELSRKSILRIGQKLVIRGEE